jgi:putative phosphoribosyl transferase
MRFKDRVDAGKKLASALTKYKGEQAIIFALPRGGVVLGYEIAREFAAPLDLVITRKIGYPGQEEYAIGAVAEDGHTIFDPSAAASIDPSWLDSQIEKGMLEAKRRREIYLHGREPLPANGKVAIIVDDGIATGLTISLAIKEIMHRNPGKVVVAVPVSSKEAAARISSQVDDFIALYVPAYFMAVGEHYEKFLQLEDEEVIELIALCSNLQDGE